MKKIFLLLSTIFICNWSSAITTVYSENFDLAPPYKVTNSASCALPNWFINTGIKKSAPNSFRDTVATGPAGYQVCFETNSFSTLNNNYVTLEFDHICKIFPADSAIIEVSDNGGATWKKVDTTHYYFKTSGFSTQGYFNSASYGTNFWFPNDFDTIPNDTWFRDEKFDISNLAANSSNVKIRFKIKPSNPSLGNFRHYGWVIDNIVVKDTIDENIAPVITIIPPYAFPLTCGTVYNLGPYNIYVSIMDRSGLQYQAFNYQIGVNGTPAPAIPLVSLGNNIYNATLPGVADGDTVYYYIDAIDNSSLANYGTLPLWSGTFPMPVSNMSCFIASSGVKFPYYDNFDSFSIWTPDSTGITNWELGTPAYQSTNSAHSAPKAWDINLTKAYTNNDSSKLVSPVFTFTSGVTTNVRLSFWQNRKTEVNFDGFRVDYSDNSGTTWNVLGTYNDPDATNWYNDSLLNSTLLPAWMGASNGWVKSEIVLDNLNYQNVPVMFRFVFNSSGFTVSDGVSIDDFSLVIPSPKDGGVTKILQPGSSSAVAPDVNTVKVVIKNFGTQNISNFNVKYKVNSTVYGPALFSGTITPNATDTFTFPQTFSAPAGGYTICAWTEVPSDGDLTNDTSCKASSGIPRITLPYTDNFDGATTYWYDSSVATSGTAWERGIPSWGATSSAHSSPNAWDINLASAYGNNAFSVLTSPIFDFTNKNFVTMKFWQNYNSPTFADDGVRLEYTPNGYTWIRLDSATNFDASNWYNDTLFSTTQPAWTGPSNGWRESKIVLSELNNAGPNVQFRFIFTSSAFTTGDGHSIDDFSLKAPLPVDAGILKITKPVVQSVSGALDSVTVILRNFGTTPLTSCNLAYKVNGVLIATEPWTGNLALFGVDTFRFATKYTSPSGYYDLCAYTVLAGDADHSNDTVCKSIFGIPRVNLTYSDNFDTGPQQWYATTNDSATQWQLGTPAYGLTNSAHSAPKAWDVNLTSGYGDDAIATLFSPIIDFTNQYNVRLNFWQNRFAEASWDGTRLDYSTDLGVTWNRVDSASNLYVKNWYNDQSLNSTLLPAWTGSSNGWKESRMVLKQLNNAGPNVQFRFVFTSDGIITNDGFSIDDFNVIKAPDYDAAGIKIITPKAVNIAGDIDSVRVTICNFGALPITTMNIVYVLNGGTPVSTPWTGNILPGDCQDIAVTTFTIPSGGFSFCFYPDVANDGDNSNDTICDDLFGVTKFPISYYDDLEGVRQFYTLGATNEWQWGAPFSTTVYYACTPVKVWKTKLIGAHSSNRNDDLYSPYFDFSLAYKAELRFCNNFNTDAPNDGGRVDISVDTGKTWTTLGSWNDGKGTNWYTPPLITTSGKGGFSGNTIAGWNQSSYPLDQWNFHQGLVQFRFNYSADGFDNRDGWAIDNFEIFNPLILDITPVAFTTIPNPFQLNGPTPVTAWIKNKGSHDIYKFLIALTVDGDTIVTDQVTLASPLITKDSIAHTFSIPWIPGDPILGGHDLCILTSLPNDSLDLDPTNDKYCTYAGMLDSVKVDYVDSVYCNDFEDTTYTVPRWIPLNGYSLNYRGTDWAYGTPNKGNITSAYSGNIAWITKLDTTYDPIDSSALYSPVFEVDSDGCYEVSFYHNYIAEMFQDGGVIEYTVDNGTSWHQLGTGFEPNWYNSVFITSLSRPATNPRGGFTGNSNGWVFAQHNVKFYNPAFATFRFRFGSDYSLEEEGWAIDDFCFKKIGPCTIGIDEFEINGFALGQNYPNPSNQITTIPYALATRGKVKLYLTNLLGQEIKSIVDEMQVAGQYQVEVDINSLSSGIYYYTLEFDEKRLVRKMVVIE